MPSTINAFRAISLRVGIAPARDDGQSPVVLDRLADFLAVIGLVAGDGERRSWGIEHAIDGLSGKVLNERLLKLMRFGILAKETFAEVPPRVEYRLTPFGEQFGKLIDDVDELHATMQAAPRGD